MRREQGQGKRILMTRLGVGLALSLGLLPATEANGKTVTDRGIADAIEDEFLFDRAVPFNSTDVHVTNGIATLSGTVTNMLAKERAARIARTVKGVRGVVNRIAVKAPRSRNDARVESAVESALLKDPATDSWEIGVSCIDGIVSLSGSVDSWQEKELAETVAKGVMGVVGVQNDIAIDFQHDRADAEIKPEIEQRLRWDALVDHGLIVVEVEDGNVTLTGTVGSAAEKTHAAADAWVTGVKSVDHSGLEVKRWARDDDLRTNKYVATSDSEIRRAIEDALVYDLRVYSFNVTPEVVDGIVTLRGNVDNLKAKRSAAANARNTVGVIRVRNRLKVKAADERSDVEIAADLRDALTRDPYVERYEIAVSVHAGIAYLRGTVDSYFEKGQAEDVATRVNGVADVDNNLIVEYDGPIVHRPYVDAWGIYDDDWYDYEPSYTFKTDTEIKEDIRSELFWSPFVDENQVKVSVENGVATLTGQVDTWMEHGAAVENAYEGGATWVRNQLTIE